MRVIDGRAARRGQQVPGRLSMPVGADAGDHHLLAHADDPRPGQPGDAAPSAGGPRTSRPTAVHGPVTCSAAVNGAAGTRSSQARSSPGISVGGLRVIRCGRALTWWQNVWHAAPSSANNPRFGRRFASVSTRSALAPRVDIRSALGCRVTRHAGRHSQPVMLPESHRGRLVHGDPGRVPSRDGLLVVGLARQVAWLATTGAQVAAGSPSATSVSER
jgi:hypothetical protein